MNKAFLSLLLIAALSVCGARSGHGGQLTDEIGRRVRVPDRPRRIVSLAPGITECLFALGMDEELVGVTQFSNYPPEAASKPKVGSYIRINLEKILSLRPDLVIATRDGNPKATVLRISQMGIAVYVVDPRDMAGLFRMLRSLGRVLNRRERANQLVADLEGRLDAIRRTVGGRPHPRVLLQVGIDPMVTVGWGTLQDQLIHLAGGDNIAAAEPIAYPFLSIERVLEARPDVILVSSMVGKTDARRELDRWRRWKALPAVVNRRLHVIDGDLIDRPAPRILDGLEQMAGLIHPEAFQRQDQAGIPNRSATRRTWRPDEPGRREGAMGRGR